MERTVLRRYLADKKEIIKSLDVFQRNIVLPRTKNFIIPLVGPRRAGKSYALYDLILNKLKISHDSYIFMNFEDPELADANFKDILNAVNIHEESYGKKPEYIFLDEVQVIENWQRAVRGLFETKRHYIFICGSSSKLLSKEIVSALRGRTLTYTILPLSFEEFLNFRKFEIKNFYSTSEENRIKNSVREYLRFGGFPDIVIERQVAEKFFKEYIDLVVFKDIVERHKIKNIPIIRLLIKSLLSAFSKEFSVHKLFSTLKSQGIKISKKTLYSYTSYFEDSFFAFFLKKFSYSAREAELSIPKVFINDTGLVGSVVSFSENLGRLMENVVFLELKRAQNEKPALDFYYYKLPTAEEVDFVIKEGTKVKMLIQVTYSSEFREIDEKKLRTLIKVSKDLKCSNLLVITWDYEDEKVVKKRKIKFVPLWKWLLSISRQ